MKKKLTGIIVTMFCMAAFITLYVLFGVHEEVVQDIKFSDYIVVENSVPDREIGEIPFELEDTGSYTLYAEWTLEALNHGGDTDEGMLIGLAIYNPAGENVFCVTGESVQAESLVLELEAGKYRAEFHYLTTEERLQKLIETTGAETISSGKYAYAKDAAYNFTPRLVVRQMDAMNLPLLAGIVVGVCMGLLLVVIIVAAIRRDKKMECQYDERQNQERGIAYKFSFFTMLVYMGFLCMCHVAEIKLPVAEEVLLFAGMLLGISVYVIYCIRKEAYISLNENVKRVTIVFALLGIFNIFIAVIHCVEGDMIVDGILTFRCLNLLCGIVLLVLAIVLGSAELAKKKEENDFD